MGLIYAIILSNLFQAVALLGWTSCSSMRRVLPIVFAFAITGVYSVDGTTSGLITVFTFTVIGVVMNRYKYPVSATVPAGSDAGDTVDPDT